MLQKNLNILLKLPNIDELIKNNIVRQKDGKYELNSKYKIGTIELKKNIALFVANEIQNIYIEKEKLNGAYDKDLVLVQIIFNPRGKNKAKVIQILEHHQNEILCYIENKKCFSIKESVFVNCDDINANEADVVIVHNGIIKHIVGNLSDPKIDEYISLFLYKEDYRVNKYEIHPDDLIAKSDSKNRVDLTHLPFCTIDPLGAKDHDDAIYYDNKKQILYVAIADVSSYVHEGSTLDIQAKNKAFSIYLPDKVLPMLPFELSNDLCSLKPDVERLAYVIEMEVDIKNTQIKSSKIYEATIKSQGKYTYEQIDIVLKTGDETFQEILDLYKMTKKFRAKRLKKGYDFRTEELRLRVDENYNLINIDVEISSASHQLVEECMLQANIQAALTLHGGHGIFRVHDEPTLANIEKLIEEAGYLGLKVTMKKDIHATIESLQSKAENVGLEQEVDELIIQSQQQARYSSTSLGHFGLGFNDYSHFTSPIRRYADLVLHRLLKKYKQDINLDDICEHISNKEREIAHLVWDLEDRIYARWANNNIGIKCEAKIVDEKHQYAKLTDNMIGAKVILENYQGEKLFSKVKIKIVSSNIVTKEIGGVVLTNKSLKKQS